MSRFRKIDVTLYCRY